ncbi:MAG TPA: aryl-sulfate sulfotransferase [Bryobacteraceae bacterium]
MCPAVRADVTLRPSHPSPWQVGGIVTWTATPSTGDTAAYWYRFRVRPVGSVFRIGKDFGPENTFEWTSSGDGTFEIEAAARNKQSGDTSVARARFVEQSNAAPGFPGLVQTSHPLVLLYSAAPCEPGSRMKVRFRSADGVTQETPYKPCVAGVSMNFYLAGLTPESQYSAFHTIDTGDAFQDGPVVTQPTRGVPDLPPSSVLQAAPAGARNPIVLLENVFANPVAVNLSAKVVWYYPGTLSFMTRPAGGGNFFGIYQDPSGDPWRQVVREFDLTGLTLRETNAGRVNEQLAAMGKHAITSFHHEALALPDGAIAVLGSVEQVLTGVQATGAVDVVGDMLLVLDRDLQVVWTWDTFDHLDAHRRATLEDQCAPGVCPPLTLGSTANDWTHANAIFPTTDGNFLVSLRNQDWIVKINYDSGEGDGGVIWRLGKDGDFRLNSTDPAGWFSHQHDPQFEPVSATRLMILDNGNLRRDTNPAANSRGQVLELDEQARAATLAYNADLGMYSFALGATEKLPNGNYWFVAGFLADASGVSEELDATGKPVFALRTAAPVYRSYRLASMYATERPER